MEGDVQRRLSDIDRLISEAEREVDDAELTLVLLLRATYRAESLRTALARVHALNSSRLAPPPRLAGIAAIEGKLTLLRLLLVEPHLQAERGDWQRLYEVLGLFLVELRLLTRAVRASRIRHDEFGL